MAIAKQNQMSNMFNKQEVTEEPVEAPESVEEPEVEPTPQDQFYLFLEAIGGPDRAQVQAWKDVYGNIHMLPLDDDRVFIYRSIKRSEWNVMKAQFMAAGENLNEDQRKEQFVSKCIVWPNIDSSQFAFMEAGLVDTLYEAIESSSYFLTPQMIMNMTVRL